jgi:hypothetical protein
MGIISGPVSAIWLVGCQQSGYLLSCCLLRPPLLRERMRVAVKLCGGCSICNTLSLCLEERGHKAQMLGQPVCILLRWWFNLCMPFDWSMKNTASASMGELI